LIEILQPYLLVNFRDNISETRRAIYRVDKILEVHYEALRFRGILQTGFWSIPNYTKTYEDFVEVWRIEVPVAIAQ